MENHHRDKYDVSGNIEAEYVDEQEKVLVNKQGIRDLETLQIAEEEGLTKAYESLLAEVRTDTPMTSELLCHIHSRIFGDIYEWAGRWRTVQISKPGAIWPPPHYLDESMKTFEKGVLQKYPATQLTNDEVFCEALGEIQGEFLAIHPFREGNARTIKLMTNLLSIQSERPLLIYDTTEVGAQQYIDAAKAALARKDYQPMIQIIRQALKEAQS
ncbi:Adenosine monophosphate-protein transferase VbhT [Gimesia alba]|uniref:protein adenylyltransferase n=1 Tax=Gimesia alba TaxID=2527973 RepID=A0A517RHX1_9PLAN|nr:Fic family protein [Gimesia alba]QDT43472.1 Adenosine monophosphate-protein transferase VbhT [Gimesia alba]